MRNPVWPLRLVCVALCALLFVSPILAQTGSFPSNEDLRHFRRIADPRLSPDGKQVLFLVTDSTADGGKSHLWLTDLASNATRQLTFSPADNKNDKRGEWHGEWMPDGSSILFLAHRGEHTQLYRLPLQGGEAQPYDLKTEPLVSASQIPDFIATTKSQKPGEPVQPQPIDVSNFAIAPSGKLIAIIAKDPEAPEEKKEHDDKADAVWVDHERHTTHLYLFDPESQKLIPTAAPPDVESIAWAPDSVRLLVISEAPNDQGDLGPARKANLLVTATPDHIAPFEKLPPTIENAVWSADGHVIYFQAQAAQDTPPGYIDLYAYDLDAQFIRNLTDGFKGSVEHEMPVAMVNGGVLKAVAVGVHTTAMTFPAANAKPEILQFSTSLAGSFHTNARQSGWVFLGTSSTQPLSVYYTTDLKQPAQPIATPRTTPENSRTVQSKLVTWNNDRFTLEGLLYLPPDAANRRVPLVVDVHGGPAGAWQDGYDPFVAMLNGEGWAVFRPNIRGGTNYGAEFVAADKNDLGGGDYRDLMAGVDFVVKNYPVDPERLALFGYSYGGEMAGFVEGKTNRFKAIVSGAPVIDQYSEYGTENGSWYDRWYFGKPWEHAADAWRQSPLSGVAHASTPFLLLQGEGDTTDPKGQSQEMYRALRQMGVPVELVTYPRDNHGPLITSLYGRPSTEPWHGFDARRRVVEFIKKGFGETAAK